MPHLTITNSLRPAPARSASVAPSALCVLALGIVLTGAIGAHATERPHRPVQSHRTVHHSGFARYDALFAAPAIGPRAEVNPAAKPLPSPSNSHETDGLSRNPEDCVRYGCVDNGGG